MCTTCTVYKRFTMFLCDAIAWKWEPHMHTHRHMYTVSGNAIAVSSYWMLKDLAHTKTHSTNHNERNIIHCRRCCRRHDIFHVNTFYLYMALIYYVTEIIIGTTPVKILSKCNIIWLSISISVSFFFCGETSALMLFWFRCLFFYKIETMNPHLINREKKKRTTV